MRAADLREKSPEDLRELQKTLARDVFQSRLKNFTNRLDDTSAIRKARRDLARVLTVLRDRDLKGTLASAPGAAAEAAAAAAPAAAPAKAKAPKAEAKSVKPAAEKPKASVSAAAQASETAAAPPAKKKPSTKAKKSEAK